MLEGVVEGGGADLVDGRDKGVHDLVLEGAEHQTVVGDVVGGKAGGVLQVAFALVSDLQDRHHIAVLPVTRSLNLRLEICLFRKSGIDSCQPMAVTAHSILRRLGRISRNDILLPCEGFPDMTLAPPPMRRTNCKMLIYPGRGGDGIAGNCGGERGIRMRLPLLGAVL